MNSFVSLIIGYTLVQSQYAVKVLALIFHVNFCFEDVLLSYFHQLKVFAIHIFSLNYFQAHPNLERKTQLHQKV